MKAETKDGAVSPTINIFKVYRTQCDVSGTKWVENLFQRIKHNTVSRLEECDIAVLMTDITTNSHQKNEAIIRDVLAKTFGKPTVVFVHDDPEETFRLSVSQQKYLLLYRTSLNCKLKFAYEHLLPSFQASDNNLSMLAPASCDNPKVPKIGFCGVMKYPARKQLCDILTSDSRFQTMFVDRQNFHKHHSEQQQTEHFHEFMNVMNECPYQICSRGYGNFSHRFFETLAFGRIPVVLDCDTCFPNNFPPHWKDCVVFVSNIAHFKHQLLDFHAVHDLTKLQLACRLLWVDCCSYDGFARHLENECYDFIARSRIEKSKQCILQ